MRLNRFSIAGVVALAVITAGCSSGTSPSGTTSNQPPSSSPSGTQPSSPTPTSSQSTTAPSSAQGGPIDESTCMDIDLAKDDLMLAASPDKARKSADTLEKYSPPDPVKAAIEHFVTTVGARPNDPDIDANRNLIMGWLKQICPNLPSLKN